MPLSTKFRCRKPCRRWFKTQKGLNIHIQRTKGCKARFDKWSQMDDKSPSVSPARELTAGLGPVPTLKAGAVEETRPPDDTPQVEESEWIDCDPDYSARVSPPAAIVEGNRLTGRAPINEPRRNNSGDDYFTAAGHIFRKEKTEFERMAEQLVDPDNPFYPFSCQIEWEVACWLSKSGLSHAQINAFLKLSYVQARPFSFKSSLRLKYLVELLPGGPRWQATPLTPKTGTSHEPSVLFWRDPLECVAYLLSNPALSEGAAFAPCKRYADPERTTRVYNEMNTGEWWWRVQARLPAKSTVVPVILASDKTMLTKLRGDKVAWPLYLTIGNIDSRLRLKDNTESWVLVAYIPITKFGRKPPIEGTLRDRFYHHCVTFVMEKIAHCGHHGEMLADSQGNVRHCFTLLASHVADLPEKRLIACASGAHSPITFDHQSNFDSSTRGYIRTRKAMRHKLDSLKTQYNPIDDLRLYIEESKSIGLSGVDKPYWMHHRWAEPHLFLTPDILHALHKFFRDHVLKWVSQLVGPVELDARLKTLQPMIGFRQWKKGIKDIVQWTGREDRELQRCLLAVACGGKLMTPVAVQSLRAIFDFIYLAQYYSHSETTLGYMVEALDTFHRTKDEWIRLKARRGKKNKIHTHFKAIPKLSGMLDFVPNITEMGSCPQFSSDAPEKKHQKMNKVPYAASNGRDFQEQMCRHLDRREKVDFTNQFLLWHCPPEPNDVIDQYHDKVARREHRVVDLKDNMYSVTGTGPTIRLPAPHEQVAFDATAAKFQLPDMRPGLADFLSGASTRTTGNNRIRLAQDDAALLPNYDCINVWHSFRMQIPAIQDEDCLLPYASVLAHPPNNDYPYGRCYPVLICDNSSAERTGFNGYLVAQIRCIFSGCSAIKGGKYVRDPAVDPLLAYVQWFDYERYDDKSQLQIVGRKHRANGRPFGDVVELGTIVRPLQLTPVFGTKANPLFNPENVLDIGVLYYVNSFWDKELYQAVG